jgi:hypothetical protein
MSQDGIQGILSAGSGVFEFDVKEIVKGSFLLRFFFRSRFRARFRLILFFGESL